MNRILLLTIIPLIFFGCDFLKKDLPYIQKGKLINHDSLIGLDKGNLNIDSSKINVFTDGLLDTCECLKLKTGAFKTKYLYNSLICNCTLQFEAYLVPRKIRFTPDDIYVLDSLYSKEKSLNYPSFNILIFEMKMLREEDMEEPMLDSPYLFPVKSKIHTRIDGDWNITEKEIIDFDNYVEIRAEFIDSIDEIEKKIEVR